MITTKITHIANLIDLIVLSGVRNIVVSPGSRNAPIIIAADYHPEIKIHLIHDERVAAFFALGMAEELNEPVALTCTSGSAVLNYSPAIAEAYYRNIPLLILSADRPSNRIDQGEGQCIRQKNVFANFIKNDFQLPDFPKSENELSQSIILVKNALNDLINEPQGPVHLNIPLDEPLYELNNSYSQINEIEKLHQNEITLTDKEKEEIQKKWFQSEKILIVYGQGKKDEKNLQNLVKISKSSSVAVLVENTSNLIHLPKFCHHIDITLAMIESDEINDFQPDLIIYFGGAIVSKKIKAFLKKSKPKNNWRVGQFLIDEDTFESKTKTFSISSFNFLSFLASLELNQKTNFGVEWKNKEFSALQKHELFIKNLEFSDFKVYDIIFKNLPDNINLQMANSSVVRYCQLFKPNETITYFANRGVSGIDGSSSTAVGMAVANPEKQIVLITGDISFFYDSNAFWNNNLPKNLKIILINNGGGDIFNIIQGPDVSKQNSYFFAGHSPKANFICQAFGLEYLYANSELSLEENLIQLFNENEKTILLEIDTTNQKNAETLKSYFNHLSKK